MRLGGGLRRLKDGFCRSWEFEERGEDRLLLGYEERYGYVVGEFVGDKDAVEWGVFGGEVGGFYKRGGKCLYEGLMELYEGYG